MVLTYILNMPRKKVNLADYIVPLYMNGLQGRMMRIPGPKTRHREILFVYGHHASLERHFGVAEMLSRYGTVTVPDLPGFGGMQSFYKLGEKPTIDNLADYLASFVKLQYKRKKVTIVGMSLGFAIVTRMLQRFPELVPKVELLISFVGFVHKDDFHFSRRNYLLLRYTASYFSRRLPAWVGQHLALRPTFIRATYLLIAERNSKLKDADDAERRRRIDFEIGLWQGNDLRTYMDTGVSMLTLDLCHAQVALPVYHIVVSEDRYFNNDVVEQHLGVIYKEVNIVRSAMPNHGPTVISDAKAAGVFMPRRIRQLLAAR